MHAKLTRMYVARNCPRTAFHGCSGCSVSGRSVARGPLRAVETDLGVVVDTPHPCTCAQVEAQHAVDVVNIMARESGQRVLHRLPSKYRAVEEQVKAVMASKHVTDLWGFFPGLAKLQPQPPARAAKVHRGAANDPDAEMKQASQSQQQPTNTVRVASHAANPTFTRISL